VKQKKKNKEEKSEGIRPSANKQKSKQRESLQSTIERLQDQLEAAKADGNTQKVNVLQKMIDRFMRMKT